MQKYDKMFHALLYHRIFLIMNESKACIMINEPASNAAKRTVKNEAVKKAIYRTKLSHPDALRYCNAREHGEKKIV